MRAVLQRVSEAAVRVDGTVVGAIGPGFLVLAGFEADDSADDLTWVAGKIAGMRVFADEAGKMNCSLSEAGGRLLVVSQFTLHASVKKGHRPSFIRAAPPAAANALYQDFCRMLEEATGTSVERGIFGADMKVSLVNDGPVTILIDSKNKE
jgi:D-tyrosyl-tRNA(Tyr) deacylase